MLLSIPLLNAGQKDIVSSYTWFVRIQKARGQEELAEARSERGFGITLIMNKSTTCPPSGVWPSLAHVNFPYLSPNFRLCQLNDKAKLM